MFHGLHGVYTSPKVKRSKIDLDFAPRSFSLKRSPYVMHARDNPTPKSIGFQTNN